MEKYEHLNILIVDSNPAARKALADHLSAIKPYRVETTDTGTSALAMIAGKEYSAVITGTGLTDMSGFDLGRAIHARTPELPVILAASVDSMPGFAHQQSGIFDHLTVPYTESELLRITDYAVRYALLLRENSRLKCEVEMLRQNVSLSAPHGEVVSLKETERKLIVRTLKECQGNKHLAAKLLRIPRSTLYSKIQKHHICIQNGGSETVREFDGKEALVPLAADH